LTQRDLDPARRFPVASAGHANAVDAGDAGWWAVFLGMRPYEAHLSNLGRETCLLPVTWQRASRVSLANVDGRIPASEPTHQFTGTLLGVYAVRRPTP